VSAPLLDVRDLEVVFRVGDERLRAVDRVSLRVARGETLALVGESGCGKSTLARAVAGLVPIASGSVRLADADASGRTCELVALGRRAWRKQRARLQMVFQDPDASLNPRMTAAALVGEPLRLHAALRGAALDTRVCELLERVGLDPDLRRRHPHAFSGGQRQRIAIARALAVGPELLLCDEVTSALDVSIQAQILELLRTLQRDLGIAMLFITHDLGVVRHIARRVAVMYLGEIVETADTDTLFDAPAHPYTRALLGAVPRVDGRGEAFAVGTRAGEVPSPLAPPPGCRFHPRCPIAVAACAVASPLPVATRGGEARCLRLVAGAAPPAPHSS